MDACSEQCRFDIERLATEDFIGIWMNDEPRLKNDNPKSWASCIKINRKTSRATSFEIDSLILSLALALQGNSSQCQTICFGTYIPK